jgi:hypothetical protein
MKKSHDAAVLQLESVPTSHEIELLFDALKPGAHVAALCLG